MTKTEIEIIELKARIEEAELMAMAGMEMEALTKERRKDLRSKLSRLEASQKPEPPGVVWLDSTTEKPKRLTIPATVGVQPPYGAFAYDIRRNDHEAREAVIELCSLWYETQEFGACGCGDRKLLDAIGKLRKSPHTPKLYEAEPNTEA